jgi:muramoyltetrapeptide carboxypeptidase
MLLLLEDVGEATYRVDRLLTQLLGSGVLERARGVALGDFRDCRPAQDTHPPVLEVLSERLASLGVPVVAGFPIGHGARNRAVRLGRRARLDADARTLEILP